MVQPSIEEHPPIAIRLRSETEEKLRDRAAIVGMSLETFIEEIAEREAEANDPNEVIAKAVARIQSRTQEQLLTDRDRILGLTPPPRPIPEGKTFFDVVQGTWPGDESDEEIRAALERLS